MLQHDYILEMIEQFVRAVEEALLGTRNKQDVASAEGVEEAVAELLDLDAQTAMALAPESLVTMMELSGIGESVAAYAAYALRKTADIYEGLGQEQLAELRLAQGEAVARAFSADGEVPPELLELEGRLEGGAS